MKLLQKEEISIKTIQLLLLLAAGIVIFPAMLVDGLFPGYGTYAVQKFIVVPSLLFFGSALSLRLSSAARRSMLLSVAMVLWFVMVQTQRWLTQSATGCFSIFAVGYLLAFPFATVTEDGGKQLGLKWIGGFYVAYALLMVVFAGMLLMDAVPDVLASSVRLDGTRAAIFSHPNGGGCILMLGIGFSLYFMTRSKKKWQICVWGVLTALQFGVQTLTNSRTSIFITAALLGGTLFFRIWNGSWKRFLAGAAAALVVIVALFSLSGKLYGLHTRVQISKLLAQAEQQAEENENQTLYVDEETGQVQILGSDFSVQRELSEDLRTLNGRTNIWKAAFASLRDNPGFKLWGTEYASAELSYRIHFTVVNAHNAWIQMLLQMGIPGFLLAMVYTLTAVFHIWKLLWRKEEDLSRKVVALLLVCLLGASLLEVYLFNGELLFTHFLFLLCTGYLIQWNTEASAGK